MTRDRKRTFGDRSSDSDGLPVASKARIDPPSSPPEFEHESEEPDETAVEELSAKDYQQESSTARGGHESERSRTDRTNDANLINEHDEEAESRERKDGGESESSDKTHLPGVTIHRESSQGYIVQKGHENKPLLAHAPKRDNRAQGRRSHLNPAHTAKPITGGYQTYRSTNSYDDVSTSESSSEEGSSSPDRGEDRSSPPRGSSGPDPLDRSALGEKDKGESADPLDSSLFVPTIKSRADRKKKGKPEKGKSKKHQRRRTQPCSTKTPKTKKRNDDDDDEDEGDNGRAYVGSQKRIGVSNPFIKR